MVMVFLWESNMARTKTTKGTKRTKVTKSANGKSG